MLYTHKYKNELIFTIIQGYHIKKEKNMTTKKMLSYLSGIHNSLSNWAVW